MSEPAEIRGKARELATERRFYAQSRAFGRFGMRIFKPQIMDEPHWHGHIEANFLTSARMVYAVDGSELIVPESRLVVFWAAVPHQLLRLLPGESAGTGPAPRLGNIYLPVDAFLFMQNIPRLQVTLLSGGIIALPVGLCDMEVIERWYADYRSGDYERLEILKMEINAVFRRAQMSEVEVLRAPMAEKGESQQIPSTQIRHVVEMVRFITENLAGRLLNAEIAAVTGLHENYALSLFSRVMRLSPRQFVIRMRLLRARALLTESTLAISSVAETAGFSSISQFYHHFRAAYGTQPHALRKSYRRAALR